MKGSCYRYFLHRRRKLRRRFRMKTLVSRAKEEKYLIYVMRSNKNLHISMLGKNGEVLLNANTIKARRENPTVVRRDLVVPMAESFAKKILEVVPGVKSSQLVYDIFHHQYGGTVKSCIDKIKEVVSRNERSE